MKVKDLKKLLESFEDELDVIRPNSEGGYFDVKGVKMLKYCRDINQTSYEGPHEIIEDVDDMEEYKSHKKFKGIILD